MLRTVTSHTVKNGMLTEIYTVEIDTTDNSIFVRIEIDPDGDGPIDSLHVDHKAAWPLIRGLLVATNLLGIPDTMQPIQFVELVPHQAPDTIDVMPDLRPSSDNTVLIPKVSDAIRNWLADEPASRTE